MKTDSVTLLIPCLNERNTIKAVVLDAKRFGKRLFGKKFELLVADNGSTDGTLKILKRIKGVRIINVPVRGYGAALHWGINKAKGKYVLFADADMSYPFSNSINFCNVLSQSPDLVLGSRIKGKIQKDAMPFLHRYFGTPFLTFLIRCLYRINVSDCNSGMRMVKKTFYKKLNMRNSGMEWASELICKTAIKHGRYIEVPIKYLKDKRGKEPHLSSWSDGWRHLKAILLLKPETLYFMLLVFILGTVIYYNKNFTISFLFADLSAVFFLSLITLNLLGSLIEKKSTKISSFLLEFRLVPATALLAFVIGVSILFIPDDRLGTKLFLVSIIGILFMWIFLIETIKTHLANRLPDV